MPECRTHLDYVRYFMTRDYEWWTLEQLRLTVGRFRAISETGLSARIRDLRKEGLTVESEPVRKGSNQYRYRVVPKGQRSLF